MAKDTGPFRAKPNRPPRRPEGERHGGQPGKGKPQRFGDRKRGTKSDQRPPPRPPRPEKPMDPNSPFAKLLALKEQMKGN